MDLTPGRQRGYILYITGAKQSKTREQRVENVSNRFLKAKGCTMTTGNTISIIPLLTPSLSHCDSPSARSRISVRFTAKTPSIATKNFQNAS